MVCGPKHTLPHTGTPCRYRCSPYCARICYGVLTRVFMCSNVGQLSRLVSQMRGQRPWTHEITVLSPNSACMHRQELLLVSHHWRQYLCMCNSV